MTEDPMRRLGTPIGSLASARGNVNIWRPGTGLLVTRVTGYLSTDGAREIASSFRRQLAEDSWSVGFHEWGLMEDYDSEARVLLTRAVYEQISSVKAAHFLVRSRIVAFGVQAANIVLRRLTLHETEGSFHRELSGALAKRGSYPPARAAGR